MQKISALQLSDKAKELCAALEKKNMTVGFAESCTGGLIGKTVTDIPGASKVFLGGIISYANEVKSGVLGVSRATLDAVGAVSADVAMQMALGAREVLGVDFSASVTGIAGPGGGSDEKPVGTVYIAVCYGDDRVICEKYKFDGEREDVRIATAYTALDMILGVLGKE